MKATQIFVQTIRHAIWALGFSLAMGVSLNAWADFSGPPINFNAGQGNHTVTFSGTVFTMGASISIPKSVIKNVKMPKNQTEFCAAVKAQNYENLTTKVTTCSFSNGKGKLAGIVSITGIESKFEYYYVFL